MIFSSGASVATVASIRTWSLPLPVQPWAIVSQPCSRRRDGELGDQRPAERREQRVAAAVEGVGLDRRQDVVAGELLAGVDDECLEGAEVARLAGDDVPVLAGLAEVDAEGDHLCPVLLLDPAQHDAGVEAARVEQQHAPDLLGVGLVGGDSGVALALGHWRLVSRRFPARWQA